MPGLSGRHVRTTVNHSMSVFKKFFLEKRTQKHADQFLFFLEKRTQKREDLK
jgi:hypothetical protein